MSVNGINNYKEEEEDSDDGFEFGRGISVNPRHSLRFNFSRQIPAEPDDDSDDEYEFRGVPGAFRQNLSLQFSAGSNQVPWLCAYCGNHNFQLRAECLYCKNVKSDQPPRTFDELLQDASSSSSSESLNQSSESTSSTETTDADADDSSSTLFAPTDPDAYHSTWDSTISTKKVRRPAPLHQNELFESLISKTSPNPEERQASYESQHSKECFHEKILVKCPCPKGIEARYCSICDRYYCCRDETTQTEDNQQAS